MTPPGTGAAAPVARPKRWRRRLARFGLAVVAGVLVLELALDLASWQIRSALDRRPTPAGAGRRVLCIGDSWTYGVGAAPGHSYPDYLQRQLGDSWVVVNEGRPGQNSSQIGTRLRELLDKHHPETVFVMAGLNNAHNTLGGTYRELLDGGYIDLSPAAEFAQELDHFLWNFAVYRLVRWSLARPGGEMREFEALPARAPAPSPEEPVASEAGAEYPWQQLEAAARAEEAGDVMSAMVALGEAFAKLESARGFGEVGINHLVWARDHAHPDDFDGLVALLRARFSPEDFRSQVSDVLLLTSHRTIGEKMLWFDLAKMNDAARAHGARLVLVAYPGGAKRETMAAFAEVHGVPFIDTAGFSVKLLLDRSLLSDDERAAKSRRLSARGNEAFAAFVIDQARARGLLGP
jgi:hypothetical protein